MDPDNKARLFYLLILLVGIGGYALYHRRDRLGASLQQAAIWCLIFIGVIIAYGFKDVLSTQLYPRQLRVIDDKTVMFPRARDSHFYATLNINGVDVEFVVDTGATDIVLTQQDARRIGIEVDKLSFLGQSFTANGPVGTARVTLGTVKLGNQVDYDLRASVNEGDLFDSLLGQSYLDNFTEIRIIDDKMYLTR